MWLKHMDHKSTNPYWPDIEESLEAIVYECVEEWKYLGSELGNTKVMVVPDEGRLEDALEALRSTCTDKVFGLNLQWVPDSAKRATHAAVITLASARMCVLIKTLDFGTFKDGRRHLPACLLNMLTGRKNTFVAWGWQPQRKKFSETFELDPDNINVIDAGAVCKGIGCFAVLRKVAGSLLRVDENPVFDDLWEQFSPPSAHEKWRARELSANQVAYAAFQTLATLGLFRVMNTDYFEENWCNGCGRVLSRDASGPGPFYCKGPDCKNRGFPTFQKLHQHCVGTKCSSVDELFFVCCGCQRTIKRR